ncbi:MAG: class I SAM-dependent methyltransferase [Proteobacteria bacterium]|nr:MAG: class I SAM-dependent methyltransferase [Pseudomonadota bacterium]
MANYQFSYECLFYPKVAMTGQTDPQVRQIEEIILSLRQNDEKIRVLDFGMGKGRLLATIAENSRLTGTDVREWLDYFGYDKFPTYKQMCEDILKTAYGQTENRYYNDQQRMLSDHPENSFDLIIMTNVLHEIEPSDWITIFTSQINLFKLLKDDGFLLIVEDQLLTIGEKAHAKGFLVLDTLELKKLFAITSSDNYRYKDARGDGKLKAHFIPKAAISRVTATTRKEALETLIDASKDRIRHLRSQPDSYKNGRLHAFWTQQLANSSLALEELSGTPH